MMTLEQFEIAMNGIETQMKIDEEFADKLGDLFPNAFSGNLLPPTDTILETMIKLLTQMMDDQYNYIEYFIYELEFGKRKDLGVYDEFDNKIKLDNISDLYHFLIISKNVE